MLVMAALAVFITYTAEINLQTVEQYCQGPDCEEKIRKERERAWAAQMFALGLSIFNVLLGAKQIYEEAKPGDEFEPDIDDDVARLKGIGQWLIFIGLIIAFFEIFDALAELGWLGGAEIP